MSKVVVTGGAGFIGGHLVRRLLADGHHVVIVDSFVNSNRNRIPGEAEWIMMDVRDYGSGPYEGAEAVFHLAAVSRTPPAVQHPLECVSVNVDGTARVLESALKAGVKRVIFSSSNVVYAADTAYKMSKLSGEMLCDVYSNLYGLSTVKLRYSNVYGSGMMEGDLAVFASLRDSKNSRGFIEITGDGGQSRDFTHVSDIVEANLLAWKSDYVGDALDICTGINHTMNEVAPRFKCEVKHVGERKGDVKHIVQNPFRARSAIGWKARVSFEEGFDSIWRTTHDSL